MNTLVGIILVLLYIGSISVGIFAYKEPTRDGKQSYISIGIVLGTFSVVLTLIVLDYFKIL